MVLQGDWDVVPPRKVRPATTGRTSAPFGGYKTSGIGRELGEQALDNDTENKTVTIALE
jgi:acyl-CoA reductase-like NAD-dependent aldehyde dehydrogenase